MAWEEAEQAAVDREDWRMDVWPNVSSTRAELRSQVSGLTRPNGWHIRPAATLTVVTLKRSKEEATRYT